MRSFRKYVFPLSREKDVGENGEGETCQDMASKNRVRISAG